MTDIPRIHRDQLNTELTREVQPTGDRDQRRARHEREETEKEPAADQDGNAEAEPPGGEAGAAETDDGTGDASTGKARHCEDEPGQIIDLEA